MQTSYTQTAEDRKVTDEEGNPSKESKSGIEPTDEDNKEE